MKPPKRSPFLHSRQADLLEIYRHLYPDSIFLPADTCSGKDAHKALSVVQMWINRSACPFAVETTALLVQSVILDEHMQRIAVSTHHGAASTSSLRYALEQMGGGAELGVRLNYSLALTRFVNSVVDSHQTGGFAHSIAAIAARIGLPLWFVEIRHAVTHEELPSISVCRQAAGAALAWLDRHFWVPQLFAGPNALQFALAQNQQQSHDGSGSAMDVDAPTAAAAEASASTLATAGSTSTNATSAIDAEQESRKKDRRKALQDFRLTLKSYRQLSKQVTRDRSLINTSKDQFRRLYKQFAVFVSRIRTLEPDFATQFIDNAGAYKKGKDEEIDMRNMVLDPDDVDECTKSALADLVNLLLMPGGLIPLSKSKRVKPSATGPSITLPTELANVWNPLLGYLRDTLGGIFGQLLTEELVEAVLFQPDPHLPDTQKSSLLDEPTSASATAVDESEDPSWEGWKEAAFSDISYRKTAEAWIRYLATTIPPPSQIHNSASTATSSPTMLITDRQVVEMCLPMQSPASTCLLEFLCERNEELKGRIGALVAVLKVSQFVAQEELELPELPDRKEGEGERQGEKSGFEQELEKMQSRLKEMDGVGRANTCPLHTWTEEGEEMRQDAPPAVDAGESTVEASKAAARMDRGGEKGLGMPKGWSMAPESWKATPFGCLNGRIPNLVLDI
ncbi:uncharacterized protein UDID_03736 [Ustilago sp. UG-2017a]|nr:uncharacterized protein UDID_03736 [Ustilago sp. UG-2017a]